MSTIMTVWCGESGLAAADDFTVAVEAKCPVVKWKIWSHGQLPPHPKSNLRQQLERDIALAFIELAALHL